MCLISVKMHVSLIWSTITESRIIQNRCELFSLSSQHTASPAFYVCLPLSNNCLHNHLLTLISASFPQFGIFYTLLTFLCGTPHQIQCILLLFPVCLLLCFYLTCPLALSLSCPASLHWWVFIDYCTWIVWWNATRPPSILSSVAPGIPLPASNTDCLCLIWMLDYLSLIFTSGLIFLC